MLSLEGYKAANSAFHPIGVGKWVVGCN